MMLVTLFMPLLASSLGCSMLTDRSSAHVHYIQIRDSVAPMELYVSVGDQIRWQNLRSEPVKIGIMHGVDLEQTRCNKGFRSFGVMDDFATIKSRDYVSLCFIRPGIVHYNIWMDANDATGKISRTAVIHVERS
jgi:hypothetical protein